jgi:hypothetical protein
MMDTIRRDYQSQLFEKLQSAGYQGLAMRYVQGQEELKSTFQRQADQLSARLLASASPSRSPPPRSYDIVGGQD